MSTDFYQKLFNTGQPDEPVQTEATWTLTEEEPQEQESEPEPKKDIIIKRLPQLCDDWLPPEKVEREVFVVCPPTYLDNSVPNNVYMGRGKQSEPIDLNAVGESYRKFTGMLRALDVKVYEMLATKGCQDQPYVANIGIYIRPHMIVANFKAAGRECEERPAMEFFHELHLSPIHCKFDWEGEADLKYLRPNLYAGGVGKFSVPQAYEWMADLTGKEIIQVEEISDKLYHLDCSLLRIDDNNILITPEGLSPKSIRTLQERIPNVWVTPPEFQGSGFTNVVLVRNKNVLIHEVYDTPEEEAWMDAFCKQFGLVDWPIEISEYEKSGADWSCCHMHLTGYEPGGAYGHSMA